MIENGIMTFIDDGGWHICVFSHQQVIAEDIRWAIKWHSKHAYFYLKISVISVVIFKPTNSDPKLKLSTVFWHLLNKKIEALLVYMMIYVHEILVSKFLV